MKSLDQMVKEALHLQNLILEMQVKSALQGKQSMLDRLEILEVQMDIASVPNNLNDTGCVR
jgi:hypothetical protein